MKKIFLTAIIFCMAFISIEGHEDCNRYNHSHEELIERGKCKNEHSLCNICERCPVFDCEHGFCRGLHSYDSSSVLDRNCEPMVEKARCPDGHNKCRICRKCRNSRCPWGFCRGEHPNVWVPIDMDLPMNDDPVLVLLEGKYFTIARLTDFGWYFTTDHLGEVLCSGMKGEECFIESPRVTHWKPLWD